MGEGRVSVHPRVDLAWLANFAEAVVEPGLPIVDAHHHLWNTPTKAYLAQDLLNDINSGHYVRATIFVECRSMYRQEGPEDFRSVGETEFWADVGRQASSQDSALCAGIVGPVNLSLGGRVEAVLEAHITAALGRFRGVRPDTAWHKGSQVRPSANVEGLLMQPVAHDAIEVIQRLGLSLDVWNFFTQLDDVAFICRTFPDLTVVINHAGSPLGIGPYAGRRDEMFPIWRAAVERLGALPNAVMKIGGLAMGYAGFDFHLQPAPPSSDQLASAWAPYVDVCIQAFGPDRCMFESNFPVDKGMCGYGVLWNAFKKMTVSYTAEDRRSMFSGTATSVYRL